MRLLGLLVLFFINNFCYSQLNIPCNNWLNLPSYQSFVNVGDLDIPGNKVTLEAIFVRTTPYSNGYIWAGDLVSKHVDPVDVNYLLRPNNTEITTTSGYYSTPPICEIELNKVYHVAMVYDGNSLRFFRNGFLMSSIPATGNLIQNNHQTRIGLYDAILHNTNLIGYINEVRIWNVARTQAEIRANMNSSLPNPTTQTGLLAYYTFDNLLNKQGNSAWNGTLGGSASINQTISTCSFFIDSCSINPPVTASFTSPSSVCVNTPVQIVNTSVGASSYYWSFCEAAVSTTPDASNLGNPGGLLNNPTFMDLVKDDNGNYFAFSTNNSPAGLLRMKFGNSLLNTPVTDIINSVTGVMPLNAEGVQIVKEGNKWVGIVVGGDPNAGNPASLLTIDFGASLDNPAPVGTNWGNLGNMSYPHDLIVFKESNNWHGITVNARNNSITRFDFGNNFSTTPIGVNIGNIGNLNIPVGIGQISRSGNWHLFITNGGNNTLSRLDFGNSLLNIPTAVNIGNPSNILNNPRDISFIDLCGGVTALTVNAGTNSIVQLDFQSDLTSTPSAINLGNIGALNFPHSISELFRINNDIYSLIPNVNNNSLTRIRFAGCQSIPASTQQQPPPIVYNQPGVYNINLLVDVGLPTQTSFCQQITVLPCAQSLTGIINTYTPVFGLNPCNNSITVEDASTFNIGDTVLIMQMKGAIIDSSNTASFGTITEYRNAGNYEFNYIKSKTGNIIELNNVITRLYDIPDGKVQLIRVPYYQNATVSSTLTCLPWDGNKGGVLVLNVQDSISLSADIDVSGKGFKGGIGFNPQDVVLDCFQNDYNYPISLNRNAGQKGESITTISQNIICGKGSPAGGGGGGLGHNSGGGGGANGGAGGFGGYQLDNCGSFPFDNRGIGGYPLAYTSINNRVFMGSGGGAGEADNPGGFTPSGGNGGGIIILIADKIKTNSFLIKANGDAGLACTSANCHDGMGGGGAGGAILISNNQQLDNLITQAKGGDGANMVATTNPSAGIIGPGGGGGGGVVFINNAALPVSIIPAVNGGNNGVLTQGGNAPYGATPGQNGTTLFNLTLPISTTPFQPNIDSVRFNANIANCSSFDFEGLGYTNTHPIIDWQWYFGDGNTANTQNTSHIYATNGNYIVKLVVTDINGCKDSISQTVISGNGLDFDFNYKQDVCDPLTVQFTGVGTDNQSPYWSYGDGTTITGVTNPVHTYTATGNFVVKYSVDNGTCTDTITKMINISFVDDNIILTKDTTICDGATLQLQTNESLDFCWSPTTYLDDPNSPNPVTSTLQNITYYFTAEIPGNNIITNGDFSSGNTGFTSAYNYATPNITEGQYFVGPNPQAWNASLSACNDHTTGTGNMLLVNGSPTPDIKVWSQTVTVQPNTNYAFSTWIQALWPPNPAQLQFSINNNDVGTLITASLPTCTWTQFYTTWNSGNSTTANISIVNKNTQVIGNDFALDDISFAPVLIKRDSVIVNIEKPSITASNNTSICEGRNTQLDATGSSTYSWTPTTGLSNPAIANPVATPLINTQYIVTGISLNGCIAKDTVDITVNPKPAITKSANDTICINNSAQLFASGGSIYNWTPVTSLDNPNIPNPLASPTSNTTYYVTVTDGNSCTNIDSIMIAVRPANTFAVDPVLPVCLNKTTQLNASGGDTYSWQPSTSLNNNAINNPIATPLITTTYSVLITDTVCNVNSTLSTIVTVLPLPNISATKSNDIDCSNPQSQLSAIGALQYSWTPLSTLNNPNSSNPIATPAVTTQYIVAGTDAFGCMNYDSIIVEVNGDNKSGYLMATAFTPNNDGKNDCYRIKYWGTVLELEFSIYNRWGERIFFTRNPNDCWDGTYKGVPQNPDVFVYMIKAKTSCESNVFRKGTFVLIR